LLSVGIRVLKSVPLLAKLDQKERAKLVKELVERHFKAGAYIIKQGEPGSEFFIVKNGELKVTATNSGAEVEIGELISINVFIIDVPSHRSRLLTPSLPPSLSLPPPLSLHIRRIGCWRVLW
jgi:CRP-like cAMP-binding protein